jgi:acetyl-CoA acetyltransferase
VTPSISAKRTIQSRRASAPGYDVGRPAKLTPYFKKDGAITAGNASGIVDGAAAMIMTTADIAKRRGLKPIGRAQLCFAGVEPSLMGIGPAPASRNAC